MLVSLSAITPNSSLVTIHASGEALIVQINVGELLLDLLGVSPAGGRPSQIHL